MTNRAMPVCKVVEVLQDFLSEYVDKKLTRGYNVILYLSIFNSFRVIRCLSQCVSPKISILTTFLFPLGTPLGQSRRTLYERKDKFSACQTPPSTYPSIFNSFSVIRTASAKKSPFSSTAAHIFVSPGDAPATITQYIAWMERQFDACQTPRSMYLFIFNSFRVIRCFQCVSPKIAIFTTFCFPWGRPGAITLNVVWMERDFDAYKLSRSMYPSIFNSFSVIRTASAKNCRFHLQQPTFLFPLETPRYQLR